MRARAAQRDFLTLLANLPDGVFKDPEGKAIHKLAAMAGKSAGAVRQTVIILRREGDIFTEAKDKVGTFAVGITDKGFAQLSEPAPTAKKPDEPKKPPRQPKPKGKPRKKKPLIISARQRTLLEVIGPGIEDPTGKMYMKLFKLTGIKVDTLRNEISLLVKKGLIRVESRGRAGTFKITPVQTASDDGATEQPPDEDLAAGGVEVVEDEILDETKQRQHAASQRERAEAASERVTSLIETLNKERQAHEKTKEELREALAADAGKLRKGVETLQKELEAAQARIRQQDDAFTVAMAEKAAEVERNKILLSQVSNLRNQINDFKIGRR